MSHPYSILLSMCYFKSSYIESFVTIELTIYMRMLSLLNDREKQNIVVGGMLSIALVSMSQ